MSTKPQKHTERSKDKGKAPASTRAPKNDKQSSSDSAGSDVDDEGLARLITALGDDGLDDIAQHMLKAIDEDTGGEVEDNVDEGDVTQKIKVQSHTDKDTDGSGGEDDEEGSGDEDDVDEDGNEGDVEALEEDEDAVELDNVSSVDEDAVPRQKIIINNKNALERIRHTIQLDSKLPWTETLSTTYPSTHNVDVTNDLDRELSFYKQALYSAEEARSLAASQALPFTRPSDYFAEMIKSDVHMERIRQRLLDESASIKKSEEKRREREGKKFGKQVQIEKLREREQSKKAFDEKIKSLKRKHAGGALDNAQGGDEDFEVAVEEATANRPNKRPRMPRSKRDEKYGHGGRGSVGWRSKQNTRESTDQFVYGSGERGRTGRGRGGKGRRGTMGRGTKRLGKSRRVASRGSRGK